MFPILLLSAALLQSPQAPPLIENKDLISVPGPIAPRGHDPAEGPGSDPFLLSLRKSARHGNIPAVGLPGGPLEVRDHVNGVPGWKAYRLEVAPKTTVKVRLKGLHEAWFQVKTMNRWGDQEAGMLQNRIPTGNPEASYINAGAEPKVVYFVVDTTESSLSDEAYTLFITYP
jgi:hypothetical protein